MTSNEIKKYGFSIGYNNIGIASVECLSGYIEEVLSRGDEYEFFSKMLTKPIRQKMPGAKSIVVMIRDYYQNDFPESLANMIGKIYLARCYPLQEGTAEHARLQLMKDFLSNHGCAVNSDVYIPARWVAAQTGIATFGRNNFAYAEGIGSYIVIYTIAIDMELEYDQPVKENKCPPNCRACINACPTKALYEPFKLAPNKCIAFNNWVTQDGRGGISSFIPYELREPIGIKIHGCDICQDICPRNQEKLKQLKTQDKYLEELELQINLPAILNMDDDYYIRVINPIMYNYIKDKRYFIRNAAIAMGNSQDAAYVDYLEAVRQSPDAMIREYAGWALEKIGGSKLKRH